MSYGMVSLEEEQAIRDRLSHLATGVAFTSDSKPRFCDLAEFVGVLAQSRPEAVSSIDILDAYTLLQHCQVELEQIQASLLEALNTVTANDVAVRKVTGMSISQAKELAQQIRAAEKARRRGRLENSV